MGDKKKNYYNVNGIKQASKRRILVGWFFLQTLVCHFMPNVIFHMFTFRLFVTMAVSTKNINLCSFGVEVFL